MQPSHKQKHDDILLLGLLFIETSLEELVIEKYDSNGLELHSSLLHLFTGIELIIKARLVKEHWSLIFADISSATVESYTLGDYVSAQFVESIKRLKNIVGIQLTEKEERTLTGLRNRRNRLVHSGLIESEEGIKAFVARSLVFLKRFLDEEFQGEKHLSAHYMGNFRVLTAAFDDYVNEKMKEVRPKIIELRKNHDFILRCPQCVQIAVVIQKDNTTCLFCGHSDKDPREYATLNASDPPDDITDYIVEQHDGCCGTYLLSFKEIDRKGAPLSELYVCFSCGNQGDYDHIYNYPSLGPE